MTTFENDNNLNNPEEINYQGKLDEIKSKFDTGLTEDEKNEISGILNGAFLNGLKQYLNQCSNDSISELKYSLLNFLNGNTNQWNDNVKLEQLANVLWLKKWADGTWSDASQDGWNEDFSWAGENMSNETDNQEEFNEEQSDNNLIEINGISCQPVVNPNILNVWIVWANFYSAVDSSNSDDDEQEAQTSDLQEYYMKLADNSGEIFKIKVDSTGNLYPIVESMNSNVKLLVKNNESCKNYLRSAIWNFPDAFSITIWWNEENQDYTLESYWKKLTIEPLAIIDKWIGKNLDQSLALLNFTNFLMWSREIDHVRFEKNNPKLKLKDGELFVRVDESQKWWVDWKWGKWYPIPKARFWLDSIDESVLKKFIKYNNGEDWQDDWDKKKNNDFRDKKIDLIVAPSQTLETGQGNKTLYDDSEENVVDVDGDNGGGPDNEDMPSGNAVDGSGAEGDGVVPENFEIITNFNNWNLYNILNGTNVRKSVNGNVETYYYKDNNNSLIKVSSDKPWIKLSILLSDWISDVNGILNQNNLQWIPALNVNEKTIEQLNAKFGKFFPEGVNHDNISIVDVDNDELFLKKVIADEEKTIDISKVFTDDKFCGYDVENQEWRLKILFLVSQYFDQISSDTEIKKEDDKINIWGKVLNEAAEYWVTNENIDDVVKYLNSLKPEISA